MFDKDQPHPEPKSLAEIVREETDDGRVIVRCLIEIMQDKSDEATPRVREEARQLLNDIFNGKTWITLPTPPEE